MKYIYYFFCSFFINFSCFGSFNSAYASFFKQDISEKFLHLPFKEIQKIKSFKGLSVESVIIICKRYRYLYGFDKVLDLIKDKFDSNHKAAIGKIVKGFYSPQEYDFVCKKNSLTVNGIPLLEQQIINFYAKRYKKEIRNRDAFLIFTIIKDKKVSIEQAFLYFFAYKKNKNYYFENNEDEITSFSKISEEKIDKIKQNLRKITMMDNVLLKGFAPKIIFNFDKKSYWP